jgi:CBS domain containing-hemolysin-like protein
MILSSVSLILLAGICALVAAYFSFAQVALFSTLVADEHERPAGADYADQAVVTRLLQRPRDVYLQLAAGRTLFHWLALGGLIAAGWLGYSLSHIILAALGAFLLFVLEDELPHRLVLRNPQAWALRLLPPLGAALPFMRVMSPVLNVGYRLSRWLVRNRKGEEPPLSVEELTMIAAAGGARLGAEERRMLKGIFRSSGILVADIMTPRDRVVALPSTATVAEALSTFRTSRRSRIPIFDATLDHVIGVAHAKDYLRAGFDPRSAAAIAADRVRDAYFVRQDRRIHELFEELKEGKAHLAVVVDRVGRTAGVVSLDDVLEEIVGEMREEIGTEKLR